MRVLDAHTHILDSACHEVLPRIWSDLRTVDLDVRMAESGIAAAVVFGNPFYWDPAEENSRVAAVMGRTAHPVVPVGLCNPRLGPAAVDEVRRCVLELGFRGVKVRPDSYALSANSPAMRPVIEMTAELGVPLLIHSGRSPWSHPLTIADLVRDYPEAPVVMQHMFDLTGDSAIRAAEQCPNLMFETSCVMGLPFLRRAVARIGSDRIMFGSDSPALDTATELAKIRRLGLADADEQNLLWATASRLWHLEWPT